MKYNSKFVLNVILIIEIIIFTILAVTRIMKIGVNVALFSTINDMVMICSFLIYFNKNMLLGMILANISFLFRIVIVVVFLPERLFQISNFTSLVACIYLTYKVYETYRKQRPRRRNDADFV